MGRPYPTTCSLTLDGRTLSYHMLTDPGWADPILPHAHWPSMGGPTLPHAHWPWMGRPYPTTCLITLDGQTLPYHMPTDLGWMVPTLPLDSELLLLPLHVTCIKTQNIVWNRVCTIFQNIWIYMYRSLDTSDSTQIYLSCHMTKPIKWPARPVTTHISLCIHPVWSVFAVCLMDS